MDQITTVEVKRWHGAPTERVFGWHLMTVTEALRLQDEAFRCPECLGKVRLYRGSPELEAPDRGQHYSKNVGCSLGDAFGGEKHLHLKPLN